MSEALHRTIYLEHLEECAMLFERRELCIEDPETSLRDLVELEDRMEAHIDALVLGGAIARELGLDGVSSGDPGNLHAAARVLCRGPDAGLLSLFEPFVEPPISACTRALVSALSLELSPTWAPQLGVMLESLPLGPLLARAVGCRRIIELGDTLTRLVVERRSAVDPSLVWALGELRYQPALGVLQELLGRTQSAALWSAAAIACLKLHDPRTQALLRSSAEVSAWSPLGQVLSFDVPTTWLLTELERQPTTELVTALALRGDPLSFGVLLELLDEPVHARLAAGALFLTTGAPLLEDGEDPVSDHSLTHGVLGEQDELAPGWLRLCQNPDRWRAWLDKHADQFAAGRLRRLGMMPELAITRCAALCCAVPIEIREALFDELALRFGLDPGMRPDALARPLLERLHTNNASAPVFERKELRV